MPLKKNSGKTNMYPWISHTHSMLAGACGHACSYCYVQAMSKKFPEMSKRYSGEIRLISEELSVDYGKGKTIFIEHCNDLFANDVPANLITPILAHCREYPDNTYVFQTKNPIRIIDFLWAFPPKYMVGATIETNRHFPKIMGTAPTPETRYMALRGLPRTARLFITIEPILTLDPAILAGWIKELHPEFVNIGADSKGHGLVEPPPEDIKELVRLLTKEDPKIEIKEKHNLVRLMNGQTFDE